jgi:hypothetical protein
MKKLHGAYIILSVTKDISHRQLRADRHIGSTDCGVISVTYRPVCGFDTLVLTYVMKAKYAPLMYHIHLL